MDAVPAQDHLLALGDLEAAGLPFGVEAGRVVPSDAVVLDQDPLALRGRAELAVPLDRAAGDRPVGAHIDAEPGIQADLRILHAPPGAVAAADRPHLGRRVVFLHDEPLDPHIGGPAAEGEARRADLDAASLRVVGEDRAAGRRLHYVTSGTEIAARRDAGERLSVEEHGQRQEAERAAAATPAGAHMARVQSGEGPVRARPFELPDDARTVEDAAGLAEERLTPQGRDLLHPVEAGADADGPALSGADRGPLDRFAGGDAHGLAGAAALRALSPRRVAPLPEDQPGEGQRMAERAPRHGSRRPVSEVRDGDLCR